MVGKQNLCPVQEKLYGNVSSAHAKIPLTKTKRTAHIALGRNIELRRLNPASILVGVAMITLNSAQCLHEPLSGKPTATSK